MSDSLIEIKSVANIFAKQYNLKNKSTYKWINDNKCFEPGEPYDFQLFNKDNNTLGIQVTKTVSDTEKEYIKPTYCEKVVSILKKNFDEKHIIYLNIYINFFQIPRTNENIKHLAYWLEWIVTHNIEEESYINWDIKFEEYFNKIKRFVSHLEVQKQTYQKQTIIGHSWSGLTPEPWIGAEVFVPEAVFKKENKYKNDCKNIILAVLSLPFPTTDSEYYVKTIKEKVKKSNFKEIWLIDNYLSIQNAVKIK